MTTRNNLFSTQDWKNLYTQFSDANFQSYDFETIRKVMIDYIKTYYAEYFNDYIESDEFIALLDAFSFAAQGLAFRTDLNARENFLSTAQRRDSVLKLVKQLGYSPNRNNGASGFLKITNISTSEVLYDSNGKNLSNQTIIWNDATNSNWSNQFTIILNAALNNNQTIGNPYANKTINNIATYQYNIGIPNNILPVFTFNAPIQELQSPFAVLSSNILDSNSITEQAPGKTGSFGLIYQNDGLGNSSANTGFFCLFKQGSLNTASLLFSQAIPNNIYSVNTDNINNTDLWLYSNTNGQLNTQWQIVNNANGGINSIYNNIANSVRTIYSVNSRANDQIDLVFGDGVFSQIPTGSFTFYYRTTNGLTYRLPPSSINNVVISIPYISKTGNTESLTMTMSLQYTVSNASVRDSIDDIKIKAPQFVYTQNRMVNGEDYNSFPYTQYSDIIKCKSVVRFASGVSRQIDIVDPTSKYSSTDLFAADGCLYQETSNQSFTFTSINNAQTVNIINTQLVPLLESNGLNQFYYSNYPFISLTNTWWSRVTGGSGSCTGFFIDQSNNKLQIGVSTSSLRQYLVPGSLIRFDAPAGYYFDMNNNLVPGASILSTSKLSIWSTIASQVSNGSTAAYYAGRELGGVTLSDNIPSAAIVVGVYPAFNKNFSTGTMSSIIASIANNLEFALTYNSSRLVSSLDPWVYTQINNVDTVGPFNLSTSGTSSDSSWLVLFKIVNGQYTVTTRGLNYIFASEGQVLFSNNSPKPIFDYQTNTLVNDYINILPVNGFVSSNGYLDNQNIINISGVQTTSDGYSDNSKSLVTFNFKTRNQTPINPMVFAGLLYGVGNIYLQCYIDYDNLVRWKVLPAGTVNDNFTTLSQIILLQNNFNVGIIFYASSDNAFYTITSVNGFNSVVPVTGYANRKGRQNIMFQYRHNADGQTRIDPAVSNLIDTYILTRSYDDAYRTWIADITGTISEPVPPSANDIEVSYAGVFDYKMMTDQMIMSFGNYKPLFGSKASVALQAKIQVVPILNNTISNNEIQSLVVSEINDYFSINNWDFGDTFYFSELSAYIHQNLSQYVSSVMLVPNVPSTFGSMYEILCEPNEIFISSATVSDIVIINNIKVGLAEAGQISASTIGIGS